jgi:hypothetical protein
MVAVILAAGAAASPPDAPGWVHGAAATGVVAIGMGEIGAAAIGMAATGAGVTGMGIGAIIMAIMSFLLVTLAFQGGGAGAGAADIPMDTATGIRTVITGMAIRTVTVMATEEGMDTVTTVTVTAMDMATALAANTALPLGRE